MRDVTPVKTVDRLVEILDCFSAHQPAWSLTGLSTRLGIPKSSLHRFLVSLESHGILRRDEGDNRWRLGYRLFIWGNLALEGTNLRSLARPVMEDLMVATGETAILTVYSEGEVICIEKVEADRPVRMTLEVGTRRPAHAGASCKVLMAYLSQEEVEAIVRQRGLPRLCTNTITEPDRLAAELARIRERGYAESREETDVGAWGIAAPIRDPRGQVVAAIGIAGPTSRFAREEVERYVALCQQAAGRISARLHGGVERSSPPSSE